MNGVDSESMRAMLLEKPGFLLQLVDREKPVPAEHEILIRVAVRGDYRTNLNALDGELEQPEYPAIFEKKFKLVIRQCPITGLGSRLLTLKRGKGVNLRVRRHGFSAHGLVSGGGRGGGRFLRVVLAMRSARARWRHRPRRFRRRRRPRRRARPRD